MELRLQQFIESVEQLADIRNLDTFNPIVFQLEHPVTAIRYTVCGAKTEPSYLGIPVNTTWVVLDPQSQYYRMALKLVDTNNPDVSTTITPPSGQNSTLYWNIVRTYDEIFSTPQYYNNTSQGPQGPQGPKGDPGAVDYNLAIGTLASLTGTLVINGPTSILENGTQQYTLTLTEPQILADGTITAPQATNVTAPIFLIGAVPMGTYIDTNNVLHVGNLTADTPISLHATYPSWAKSAVADLAITLQNSAASLNSVALQGPATVNSGAPYQYSIVAYWSDGSTSNPAGTWAVDTQNFGTINQTGTFTVPSTIAGSGSATISAQVTIGGVLYQPSLTVAVTKVAAPPTITSVVLTGALSVQSGNTSQYGVLAHWSDNTTTNPQAIYSMNNAALGSINANSGLMTVPSSIAASGNATVTATLTINGTQYSPQLIVSVVKYVAPPTVTGVTLVGSTSVYSGASSQYTVDVSWSDGTTTNPAANSWGLDSANFGTISTGGTLSVPSSIAASGTVVITANVSVNGTTYNPNISVNVTLVTASNILPFYGTGPALPPDWQAFVTALPNRGPTPDLNVHVKINCIGNSTWMYFAAPVSYGTPKFYDNISQFYGGWGGAGNPSNGPSAASIAAYNDMPVTANITIGGVSVPFYIFRSDMSNLGAAAGNDWTVSP